MSCGHEFLCDSVVRSEDALGRAGHLEEQPWTGQHTLQSVIVFESTLVCMCVIVFESTSVCVCDLCLRVHLSLCVCVSAGEAGGPSRSRLWLQTHRLCR